jgi:hypothetical protein
MPLLPAHDAAIQCSTTVRCLEKRCCLTHVYVLCSDPRTLLCCRMARASSSSRCTSLGTAWVRLNRPLNPQNPLCWHSPLPVIACCCAVCTIRWLDAGRRYHSSLQQCMCSAAQCGVCRLAGGAVASVFATALAVQASLASDHSPWSCRCSGCARLTCTFAQLGLVPRPSLHVKADPSQKLWRVCVDEVGCAVLCIH